MLFRSLFLDWGITFDSVYTVPEKSHRKVSYADKQTLEQNIVRKHFAIMAVDTDTGEIIETPPDKGTGTLHAPVEEKPRKAQHIVKV